MHILFKTDENLTAELGLIAHAFRGSQIGVFEFGASLVYRTNSRTSQG